VEEETVKNREATGEQKVKKKVRQKFEPEGEKRETVAKLFFCKWRWNGSEKKGMGLGI